jgi:hypothetical protein
VEIRLTTWRGKKETLWITSLCFIVKLSLTSSPAALCSFGVGGADFAHTDPYVTGGLVKRWEVRPWTVVVGNQ